MSKYEMAIEIAACLVIVPPAKDTSEADLDVWIDWWRESLNIAKSMSPEEQAYMKQGGWWPPSTAKMVGEVAPEIVIRARLGAGTNSKQGF